MKQILLSSIFILSLVFGSVAQSIDNDFFDKVSYVGAFGSVNWTNGWTEWDPINKVYPEATVTKGNGQFTNSAGTHIAANETWSGVVKLDGWVYVDAGATLTIDAGTIVRATQKSGLFVQRGGKINAVGTSTNPIVFTSNQAAGLRFNSDWAGIVLCGKAVNNLPGGEGIAEGGIDASYGGTEAADNSGKMQYVRIEFPGFEVATGSEVNGLTFCSVGSGTTIDHIQISYSGDDAYEWFGGSVNAKYLISYKTEDDDFDTDNGFVGMVQFGLISRDKDIVDSDTANAFESDNDAAGSTNTPFTHAVFSNISAFGPYATTSSDVTLKNHQDGAAMRIRRSSKLQIYNSLLAGWGRGLRIESDNTLTAAKNGEMVVKNTIISGVKNEKYKVDGTVLTAATLETWFLTTEMKNKMLTDNSEAKITDAFNSAAFNFLPMSASPVIDASYWFTTSVNEFDLSNQTSLVNYPNPFFGTTTIELQVNKESYTKVVVVNIAGQVVANLQDGNLSEGDYRFTFDGTNLPKGLYVAKVISNNSQKAVKMISK